MVGNLLRYRGVDASVSTSGLLEAEFVQLSDALGYSFPSGNGNSDWSRIGQGYISLSSPSEITGVMFRLQRVGTAVGMLNAVITNSVSAVQVRSDTFIAADSISTSPTNYFFALSGWTPSASTEYKLELETTDGLIDSSNTIDFIYESGADATAPNNVRAFQYPGTVSSLGIDIAFKLYSVDGASAPAGGDASYNTNINTGLTLSL